jgi:hypothetical protein
VIVRHILLKVVKWVNHFKEIGDIIVNYDPAHAALPWAGVRFVLQVPNLHPVLTQSYSNLC